MCFTSQVIPRKGPGGVAHVYIFTKPLQAGEGAGQPESDPEKHNAHLAGQGSPRPSSSCDTSSARGGAGSEFPAASADLVAAEEEDEGKLLASELNRP